MQSPAPRLSAAACKLEIVLVIAAEYTCRQGRGRVRVVVSFSDGTEAVAHYYVLPAFETQVSTPPLGPRAPDPCFKAPKLSLFLLLCSSRKRKRKRAPFDEWAARHDCVCFAAHVRLACAHGACSKRTRRLKKKGKQSNRPSCFDRRGR